MTRRTPLTMPRPLIIVFGLVLLAGLVVQPYRAQQASRFALTAALVEHQSVVLDHYSNVLGIDRAVRDGHIYSDKAPGQPFLAVPAYWVARAAGAAPGDVYERDHNLRLWWLTLWSATIPGVLLLWAMANNSGADDKTTGWVAATLVFFGSLLLPFSSLLFGHVLSAVLLFAMYTKLKPDGRRSELLLAGLLGGLAVLVEYTAVLGVVVLLVAALARYRRRVVWVLLGGIPAIVALAAYNRHAFGSPTTLSYQFSAFNDVTDVARPVSEIFAGRVGMNLIDLFLEGRGLLVATPILVAGVTGSVVALRKDVWRHGIAIAMFTVFCAIPILWSTPWGGDSPGPRYIAPAIPFLVAGIPVALQHWRRLTWAAGGISILTMFVATITDPLVGATGQIGLGLWLSMLARGELAPTVFAAGAAWITIVVGVASMTCLVAGLRAVGSHRDWG